MKRILGLTLAALMALAVGCAGDIWDEDKNVGAGGDNNQNNGAPPDTTTGGGTKPGKTYPLCGKMSAPNLFRNALCVCYNLKDIGALLVREGPSKETPIMGVNGTTKVINHSGIDGTLVTYKGLEAIANVDVRDNLKSQGNVNFTGRLKVGKDMMVGGNLSGIGYLDVGGKLGVGGSENILGVKASGVKLASYAPLSGPPCDCSGGKVLDVKGVVAKARANNDNAKAGLPKNPVSTIGKAALVLNSGSYYFGNKKSIGYVKITVNGMVNIYVDGDLDAIGYDRFKITSGSVLNLYVSGNVRTIGHMVYGDKHHPSAFRLYIGGRDKATLQVGNQVFYGSIYAPWTKLAYIGRTRIEGSLVAGSLESVGLLELYFSRPVHNGSGDRCKPPDKKEEPEPKKKDPPDPKDLPLVK